MSSFRTHWIAGSLGPMFNAVLGYCRHRTLSRPFTIDKRTYKVCMDCSRRILYSRDTMLVIPTSNMRCMHTEAEADACDDMAEPIDRTFSR
jgi:hypothetical protein